MVFLLILLLPFQVGFTGRDVGPGETRVTLLSVGAGQCAVIEPPSGRVVLIDAGSTHLADLVPKCLGPYLRHRGRTSVDTVVLSHTNYDHYSAAEEVVEGYGVREVLTSGLFARHASDGGAAERLLASLSQMHRPPRQLHPGEQIPLGRATTLEVLWPPPDLPATIEANNASLVIRLTHAGRSILFIGHNIHHVYDISDRFVVMDRGRVALQATKTELGSAEALVKFMEDLAHPGGATHQREPSAGMQRILQQRRQGRELLLATNEVGAHRARVRDDPRGDEQFGGCAASRRWSMVDA